MNPSSSPIDLYPQLLGKSWHEIAGEVQSAHLPRIMRHGRFRVLHGGNFITRVLIRLSRLPQKSDSAEVTLVIHSHHDGEKWERCFGNDEFTTIQRASAGCLVEKFGIWELRFSLRVSSASLIYDQCGARLCLGVFRMPVPLACAPRVQAREKACGSNQVHVHVSVTLPFLGSFITYDGHLGVN